MMLYKFIYREKILFICLAAIILSAAPVKGNWLSQKGKGTSAANFLKIRSGAIPASLGGAYTAAGSDISASETNPAGIAWQEKSQAEGAYALWFEDISFNYFAYKNSLGPGQAALIYKGLYISGIEKRKDETDEPEEYSSQNHMAGIAYALKKNNISYGLTAKYILLKIDTEDASAFAFDLGTKYSVGGKLQLGAALKNIGSKVKFISEGFSLPSELSLGAAYSIADSMQVSLDINFPADNEINLSAGYEYRVRIGNVEIPFRAGLSTLNEFDFKDSLSAGVGINLDNKYYFDSAWAPYGILGNTFRLSLKTYF